MGEMLQYACQHLQLAAAFYEAGKLSDFIQATGNELCGDKELIYGSYWDIIDAMSDFVRVDMNESMDSTTLYLSDSDIRIYFAFVREHARGLNVPFKQDPYYRTAHDYFCTTMLDYCPYSCWFRLVTQSHHTYGSGLSIVLNETFEDEEPLVFGLLDVLTFFHRNVELLQKENKVTPSGIVVPFSIAGERRNSHEDS